MDVKKIIIFTLNDSSMNMKAKRYERSTQNELPTQEDDTLG